MTTEELRKLDEDLRIELLNRRAKRNAEKKAKVIAYLEANGFKQSYEGGLYEKGILAVNAGDSSLCIDVGNLFTIGMSYREIEPLEEGGFKHTGSTYFFPIVGKKEDAARREQAMPVGTCEELVPFAARLKEALEECGVSQAKLAKRIGVTRGTINHYCTGLTEPSVKGISELAEALGVNPVWLCGFNCPPELRGFATNDFQTKNEKLPTEEKPSGLNEDFEESANEREEFE